MNSCTNDSDCAPLFPGDKEPSEQNDESMLLGVLNSLPSMVGYWGADLRNRFANRAHQDWFGHSPEEIKGKHIRELLGEGRYHASLPFMEAALGGQMQTFDREIPLPDATGLRHTRATYIPHVVDGKIAGFIAYSADNSQAKQAELKSVEAEKWFRSIFKNANTAIVAADASGRVADFNDTFVRLLKYDREDLANLNFKDFTHPDDLVTESQYIEEVRKGWRNWYRIVKRYLCKDGKIVWVDLDVAVIRDHQGHVERFVAVIHDVTERLLAEEKLRIAATVFESQDAMMITDAQGQIIQVNPAFTLSTGYASDEVVGSKPRILASGHHDSSFYKALWETLLRTGKWQGEILNRRKNGELFSSWLTISEVKNRAGAVTNYVGIHQDISQRKFAEAELRKLNTSLTQSRAQLRAMAAQKEARRDNERKHMAREVHDELGQVLTALRMDISLAVIRHAAHSPDLQDALKGMKILVDRAIQGVRNVSTNLRPSALDMGLIAAVEWLCHEFIQHNAIPCEFQTEEALVELDDAHCVVIFRIVQESLTNIARYANARHVWVSIGRNGNALGLEVRDDGCGFDVAAIAQKKTFGFLGMRERALALGGRLDVISTAGQGTVVGLTIPLALNPVQDAP